MLFTALERIVNKHTFVLKADSWILELKDVIVISTSQSDMKRR